MRVVGMQGLERQKVIRVDRYEFELDDGSVYRHPEPLDADFTVQEFQVIYNRCYNSVCGTEGFG